MGRVVIKEVLPASPSAVWEVVSDPRRAAEWIEGEDFVRVESGQETSPRTEWVSRIRLLGFPFHVHSRRLDWAPLERAKALFEGPFGFRMVETFRLEPHVLGTEWTWARDYALSGGNLGDWLDRRWGQRLLEQRAGRSVENLVRLLRREGGPQPPESALSVFTERPTDRPWGLDSAPGISSSVGETTEPDRRREAVPSAQGKGR